MTLAGPIQLADATAEFLLGLGGTAFRVDVIEADLRLGEIDQQHKESQSARWKAVAEYVVSLSGTPCSVSQATMFYRAVAAKAAEFWTDDKKKPTSTPDSLAISASTPASSPIENVAPC